MTFSRDRGSRTIDLCDRDANDVWTIIRQHASNIAAQNIL